MEITALSAGSVGFEAGLGRLSVYQLRTKLCLGLYRDIRRNIGQSLKEVLYCLWFSRLGLYLRIAIRCWSNVFHRRGHCYRTPGRIGQPRGKYLNAILCY
jgi:hypothetical protein